MITNYQANSEWYSENSQVQENEEIEVLRCEKSGNEINTDECFGDEVIGYFDCEECYLDEKERIKTFQKNQDR